MKVKVLIFLIAGIGFPYLVSGQGIYRHPAMFFAPAPTHHSSDDQPLLDPGAFHLDVSLGSGFSRMAGYGSFLSQYIAPSASFRFSDRFSLQGGLVISYNMMNPTGSFTGTGNFPGMNGAFTSYVLYAGGSYRLSPNILLSGTVYKTFSDPGFMDRMQMTDYPNFSGMSMSLDYKITPSLSFGASFRYDNQPLYPYPGQGIFYELYYPPYW